MPLPDGMHVLEKWSRHLGWAETLPLIWGKCFSCGRPIRWYGMKRFLLAEDGPTAVEYAMLLLLIILICLTGITMYGRATSASFESSQNQIRQATQSHP